MEPDVVGLAAYTMDSHNCQRVVRAGRAMNEGNVEVGGFPPYPVSYRAIVPRESECANLFVPVALSSSHIAYGSIRIEPVFMVLGQSAATAAAMAMDARLPVQRVDYAKQRARLLADGQALVALHDEEGRPGAASMRRHCCRAGVPCRKPSPRPNLDGAIPRPDSRSLSTAVHLGGRVAPGDFIPRPSQNRAWPG
jgi:hypothetical protein